MSHLKSEHAAPFQSDESVEQPPVEQPVNSKSPWGLEGSCQNSSQQKNATSMAPQSHITRPTTPWRMRSRSCWLIITWCQISQKSIPSSSSSALSGHDIIVWRSSRQQSEPFLDGAWNIQRQQAQLGRLLEQSPYIFGHSGTQLAWVDTYAIYIYNTNNKWCLYRTRILTAVRNPHLTQVKNTNWLLRSSCRMPTNTS